MGSIGPGEEHQVVLVPGFFGFGNFGELSYFNGVGEALRDSFAARGAAVRIFEVPTLPTASIRVRAARVLDALQRVAEQSNGPIHVIGHSTGGLDARLAIAPTASLPSAVKDFDYSRVRTLVSVCCPHFGTPVATFFCSTLGKPILRLAARYMMWVLRRGRVPLAIMLRLGYLVVRLRDPRRKRRGTFDELYEKLLNDFSDERRLELTRFLDEVSSDQSLLFQLTPAGCDLLNACTADPDVRYGSVVAVARRPTWRSLLRSMWDLYTQLVHPIYALLHFIARRGDVAVIPPPAEAQARGLLAAYDALPTRADSDGIVPTSSQLWGELIHAARADHLDVVGQYGRSDDQSWGGDWIPSYSGFDRSGFTALWSAVAGFVLRSPATGTRPLPAVGSERTERDIQSTKPQQSSS